MPEAVDVRVRSSGRSGSKQWTFGVEVVDVQSRSDTSSELYVFFFGNGGEWVYL